VEEGEGEGESYFEKDLYYFVDLRSVTKEVVELLQAVKISVKLVMSWVR